MNLYHLIKNKQKVNLSEYFIKTNYVPVGILETDNNQLMIKQLGSKAITTLAIRDLEQIIRDSKPEVGISKKHGNYKLRLTTHDTQTYHMKVIGITQKEIEIRLSYIGELIPKTKQQQPVSKNMLKRIYHLINQNI